MAKVFSLEFKVRDYEVDMFGVVNNAAYLNYLEHARHEFLHGIGIDPAAIADARRSLALAEISVRYKSPLRSREHFRVDVTVGELRGARIVVDQRIVSQPEGRPVLQARMVAVFVDERGRPLRISEPHRAALLPYLVDP